ncbi:MAG: glycosyltransferase family 2 protein [Candidatus Bathyarchaeota archaeon]|nr:MAG: glycosyltransferase family 2 protein [Candidatus Bathyarchaeota archaeon]
MILNKDAKVYVFMPARNEEKNLPVCLKNLQNQTLLPEKILVINDASIDNTQKICEQFKVDVITLTEQHKNYVTTPELAYKMAGVMNHAFPPPPQCGYIMQHNPDTILPENYIEDVILRMEKTPSVIIASGCIKGEYSRRNHPRATGRIYKTWFWNKHIKRFPLNYTYETYPLLKAQSLGFEVKCFHDVKMTTLRPTKVYKADYGYAMRELGYSFLYMLGKCVLGLPKNRSQAFKPLQSYVTSPHKLEDDDLRKFMKYYQVKQFFNAKAFLKLAG